jgi:glutamate-1-semialdehyde 2,1-aminomutase
MPIYICDGQGARVHDLDGLEYIDCNLGFGPLILGHSHPAVVEALFQQIPRGVHFGAACVSETELAAKIVEWVPGAEQVLFLNSGTEATLTAIRIARAATGRTKVAKFEGGWHGAQEFLLHNYVTIEGPAEEPTTVADMGGIPPEVTSTVTVLPYNDLNAIDIVRREGAELACVIVEPVQGAAGSLPADGEFLSALRAACDEVGAVLIMDEVITGFRVGPHGAAGVYEVTGDLTTLGKIVGGGLPVGVVCGKQSVIERALTVLPVERGKRKPVLAAGTFAGNPLTMAAGLAQLEVLLGTPESYVRLDSLGETVRDGLAQICRELEIEAQATGMGSMWGLHFMKSRPTSLRDLRGSNREASRLLAAYLLLEGILMSSPIHLGFLSTAHREDEVSAVLDAHRTALARMKADGVV